MQETLLALSVNGQIIFCTMGIFLNFLFVVVIVKAPQGGLGDFRWFMVAYAFFEILYASTVLVGQPVHFVWEKTWIFFSYRGPLIGTPLAYLGSAMYCFFYEVWMGFVVVNFVYRYAVVCKRSFCHYVMHRLWMKLLFIFLFICFIAFCALCTIYWCAVNEITKTMEDKIAVDFGITNVKDIGYTMLRLHDKSGKVSWSGIGATSTHFGIVTVSGVIIFFCAWNIWKEITKVKKMWAKTKMRLERQIFFTLVIQTVIPVILCHIPSAINLTYPFWDHVFFEPITPFFAMFTTIPKAIDPIIAMCCIVEYRKTLLKLLGLYSKLKGSTVGFTSSSANFHTPASTLTHKFHS